MTEPAYCTTETRGRVFLLTINRPEVMNALHRPANLQMQAAFDRFAADPGRWIAIITGAGPRAFSAGNDLKYQAAGGDTTQVPCGFGGGFEIALACDLIVAENAVFALPEPKLAALGGLLGLPRQVPLEAAGAAPPWRHDQG